MEELNYSYWSKTHTSSNEPEKATFNSDIYDDFKFNKKPLVCVV